MSEHKVTVDWKRETPDFAYETYNRDHDWTFDAGVTVRASANPAYLGSESCVDPEEAFVASLSSCHMLTFLAIAAKKRYVVDGYRDEAVGVLAKDAAGSLAMTEVTLRPQVTFRRREGARPRGTPATPRPGPPRLLHRQLGEDRGRRRAAVIPFTPLRFIVDERPNPTRWRRTRSACRSTAPTTRWRRASSESHETPIAGLIRWDDRCRPTLRSRRG